jgi:hypothetical protein
MLISSASTEVRKHKVSALVARNRSGAKSGRAHVALVGNRTAIILLAPPFRLSS